MSEGGREPLIRLPVDQEVFVESVQTGDSVEDVTVATEVVSFDKADDVFQLEGAIVFAGFLRRPSQQTQGSDDSDPNTMETVQHVHYRLPFTLLVPIAAQPKGIVNVKSRLSGFALTVSADHWLNATGWLEVHGLSGEQGYHFRCGGQEIDENVQTLAEPELLLRGTESEADSEGFDDFELKANVGADTDADVAAGPTDAYDGAVAGATGDWRHTPSEDEEPNQREFESNQADQVSEARGGHGWAEAEGQSQSFRAAEDPADDQPEAAKASTTSDVRNELTNLDRFFTPAPEAETEPPHLQSAPEQAFQAARPESTEQEPKPIASFEFEHQIDLETAQTDAVDPALGELRAGGNEPPIVHFSASVVRSDEESDWSATDGEEDDARHEAPAPSVTDHHLWSFVDFNGPEPRYTLRYVIVMEEETLETVADRCGCLPSELQRVNPWLDGPIVPGQALYIPNAPFTLPKIAAL
ncbi:hypothetical protein [Alicyclobacillus acidiphilus]|uniref:hypothetical protein n=1 Tax=Alicyclobacillus acidiphilus TaxID=182455 RepID=UPI00082BA738|nr:hypothetical protein [Alicyclobacillus acidiphilus]